MVRASARAIVLASSLAACACQVREPLELPAQSPPSAEVPPAARPALSVKGALLRALDDPERQGLFAYPSLEIAASRQPDGSVRVAFSVPTSGVIVADGRVATKRVDEAIFTDRTVSHARFRETGPGVGPGHVPASTLQSRTRAVHAVCGQLAEAEVMEFAVRASEEQDGFSVLVEDIPYTPGAYTLYHLSKDFEIVSVTPGA